MSCIIANTPKIIENTAKDFGNCIKGLFTNGKCKEFNDISFTNIANNATQCVSGFFTGSGCKIANNYSIDKLISKINSYIGTTPRLSCPSGYDLEGLRCIKQPPPSYKRNPGDTTTYWLTEEVSYTINTGTTPNQDNSACDNLSSVVIGVGTCSGQKCTSYTPIVTTKLCNRCTYDNYTWGVNGERCGYNDEVCVGGDCLGWKDINCHTFWDGCCSRSVFGCAGCLKTRCDSECSHYSARTCSRTEKACNNGIKTSLEDLNCEKCGTYDSTTGGDCVLGTVTRDARRSCPSDREFDDGSVLCYPKCRAGYSKRSGDVVSCWNNKPTSISIPPSDIIEAIPVCSNDKEYLGTGLAGLCYDKCPTGTTRSRTDFTKCISDCPSGFNKDANGDCKSTTTTKVQLPNNGCSPGQVSIDSKCKNVCNQSITTDCINLNCDSGFTYNTLTNRCESNAVTAAICLSNQSTINGKCYNQCPAGKFMDMTNGDCVQNCLSDFNYNLTSKKCEKTTSPDKCLPTQTTINGRCYNQCTTGYFMDADGQCIQNCSSGFTYNTTSKKCESNTIQPVGCPANTTLMNNKCYKNCTDSVMDINGNCVKCLPNYFYNFEKNVCIMQQ
jgi:hypothetical protein